MASESHKDLSSFVVPNVHPTGRELGRGAYGNVEEVEIPGAVCAAKKIHDELLRVGSTDDTQYMIDAFVRECKLMNTLRHPHIVQFLGVCYLPGSTLPSLIMERLDTSLHEFLESTPDLILTTKQSILLDVARGLLYLHGQTPPIIHRDLTARNVLLNSSLVAKITDMGVARIVNLRSDQLAATMTRGPGNITYMPPEAMGPHSKYDTSLDVFSFGNLILFTLTQQFPNLLAATYNDPESDKVIGRTEIERRLNEFQIADSLLGSKHPLIDLSKNCLKTRASNRPTTSQIVTRITDTFETSPPSRLELEKEIAAERRSNTLLKDNNKALQEQATSLQELIVAKQGLVDEQVEELQEKDKQILELQGQLDLQQERVLIVEKKVDQLLMQVCIAASYSILYSRKLLRLANLVKITKLKTHQFRLMQIPLIEVDA